MVDLTINTDVARQILTGFIRSEVTRVGFSRAVVGLSGGIDSALSWALAVEALGRENVLAVRMPYKLSSPESLAHAELLIEQLEIPSTTIEITVSFQPNSWLATAEMAISSAIAITIPRYGSAAANTPTATRIRNSSRQPTLSRRISRLVRAIERHAIASPSSAISTPSMVGKKPGPMRAGRPS